MTNTSHDTHHIIKISQIQHKTHIIALKQESSAQPEKEDSPVKTNSSAPPPSGVQDLLKRRREKLQARKKAAQRGRIFQDSDSEDSEDLEDDDFFFPVIDETLGDRALPRAVSYVDRHTKAHPDEVKNEKILDEIVDCFKDCFLSHWDKQLFDFMNSKLVTNRFKLGDADDAEFHHRYTSGMPEPFHGNQRQGIISMRQFLPTLFDGVHHSRLGALLNAFHLQVRFFGCERLLSKRVFDIQSAECVLSSSVDGQVADLLRQRCCTMLS